MNFLVVGLNHRTAPIDLREDLSIDAERLPSCLERLLQLVGQGVILSTCNRLEVYTLSASDETPGEIRRFLADYLGRSVRPLEPHLYQLEGAGCVEHLFRVSSGLDSMVVGEQQILGQVRNGYSAASEQGCARGPLGKLFHQALRVGRRVQRETSIGSSSRSVSRVSVQLARRVLGDLSQQRALVIGAGGAAQLAAQALAAAGAASITIINRTHWRAQEAARKLGALAAPFEDLDRELASADLVISSTGSPDYVLTRPAVQQAMSRRGGRPLLLIDIAVPRDIDPSAGELDQVQLYDIDALQMVTETSPESLSQEISQAEKMVREETARFLDWWETLDVVPLIAAIRERAEAIRRAEVDKTLGRLKGRWNGGSDQQGLDDLSAHLEAMTSALVKKLLHQPTMYLKDGRDPTRDQMARDLFNVDGEISSRRGRK